MTWIRQNLKALAALFGVIAVSVLYWASQRDKTGSLENALAVDRAKKKIASAVVRKNLRKREARDTHVEEQILDNEIASAKKDVVRLRTSVEEMSDAEVSQEFIRLYG